MTVNSNQIVAVRNPVVNVPVPDVLILCYFAVVCHKTIHMATAEVKPKRKNSLFRRGEKQSCVSRIRQVMMYECVSEEPFLDLNLAGICMFILLLNSKPQVVKLKWIIYSYSFAPQGSN